ncbi:hypothetical protein ABT093_35975 [Kitasatospora sp. NPDC002551]|uniref:hypothetical protein n=1 Tax=Kitasatospora sp. NPDC002551 TaxID=3154539 RepID=UPI00331EDC17
MTTFPPWAAGQRITGAALRAGLPDWTSKPIDEPRTSTTTLQADLHLTLPLPAAGVYTFDAQLFIGAGDSAADLKLALNFPAASTCHFGVLGAHPGSLTSGTSGSGEYFAMRNAQPSGAGSTYLSVAVSSGAPTWAHVEGILTTPAAGALTLVWAQVTSSATATKLLAGSHLELRRRA